MGYKALSEAERKELQDYLHRVASPIPKYKSPTHSPKRKPCGHDPAWLHVTVTGENGKKSVRCYQCDKEAWRVRRGSIRG